MGGDLELNKKERWSGAHQFAPHAFLAADALLPAAPLSSHQEGLHPCKPRAKIASLLYPVTATSNEMFQSQKLFTTSTVVMKTELFAFVPGTPQCCLLTRILLPVTVCDKHRDQKQQLGGDLNGNGLQRLICWNTWLPIGRWIRRHGLVGQGVSLRRALRFQKTHVVPRCSFLVSCFQLKM